MIPRRSAPVHFNRDADLSAEQIRERSASRIGPTRDRLAAADRRDHVHARRRPERGVELRSLPLDVHVDVPAELRAWLAQAVAPAGPLRLETVERLLDRRGVDVEPPQAREHGDGVEGQRELGLQLGDGRRFGHKLLARIFSSAGVLPKRIP
jgi:hypothetical protein